MEKSDKTANPQRLVIYVDKNADMETAKELEKQLNAVMKYDQPMENVLNCQENHNKTGTSPALQLYLEAGGLSLIGQGQSIRADLTKMLPRLSPGNLHREMLVKAAKIKGAEGDLTAVDATAGLGEDAVLLAAAGFSVHLYERDPVIAALLWDALHRAAAVSELAEVAGRMQLFLSDSLTGLREMKILPDVVLLDPMFPARQKSALIKKKFQLLQQLERPCSDEEKLLQAAIASKPRKIVIKRPLKGPFLANRKPDYSLKGKAIRYDCFVFARS